MKFEKYQAHGNDFILIDSGDCVDKVSLSNIKAWCSRRLGVGADGLMILKAENLADLYVDLYNSDGSVGQFSGNGARIIAHHLMRRFEVEELDFIMDKTKVMARLLDDSMIDIAIDTVPIWRPCAAFHDCYEVELNNPHIIVMGEVPCSNDMIEVASKYIAQSNFDEGANVHWVMPLGGGCRYTMSTFERGVGPTLSCGSGAIATTFVLNQLGLGGDKVYELISPGGSLRCFRDESERFHLAGRVDAICSGRINSGEEA